MSRFALAVLPGALFLAYWFLIAPAREDQSITGIIFEVSPGKLVLLPDRDGKPDERRGDALSFALASSTRVEAQRELGDSLRPQLHATVRYSRGSGNTLVARRVTLLDNPWAAGAPKNAAPPAAPPQAELRIREIRIQQTDRRDDAAIDSVKRGAPFYVGFYFDIKTKSALRLRYQCAMPDLDGIDRHNGPTHTDADYRVLDECAFEETIAAGFEGARYHASRVTTDHKPWKTVMLGRVSMIVQGPNGVSEARQQRIAPLEIR